ncbi:MAG: response regulator, partial [Bacteroidales bacterium]|nr:response regulator [Bacteroidales bacterium]
MAKTKVLIVEDEAIIAKDIENVLTKAGYKVVGSFPTGEAAIQAVDELEPDIILMDIMLKGDMSGIQAAEVIREKSNTPVVFLTAYADENTIDKARSAVPYGYIVKPFKENEVIATIEIALNKYKEDQELIKERDMLKNMVIEKSDSDSIFVRADYRLNRIKFTDIYYVEALKDYVVINTADNIYTTHSTMKEMQRILPAKDFV